MRMIAPVSPVPNRLGFLKRQGCSPGVCYFRYIEDAIATNYAPLMKTHYRRSSRNG